MQAYDNKTCMEKKKKKKNTYVKIIIYICHNHIFIW